MNRFYKQCLALLCCALLTGTLSLGAAAAGNSAACSIAVRNELSGNIAQNENEEFVFHIVSSDNAPLPAKDILKINGTGDGAFGPMNYTKPGIYEYTVTSVAGSNTNIKYDTTTYRVSVVVKNKDGNPENGLTAYVAAVENITVGAKTDQGLVYKGVCIYTPGDAPQTGDTSNLNLYLTVFSAAAICLILTILLGVKRRKNNKFSEITKGGDSND